MSVALLAAQVVLVLAVLVGLHLGARRMPPQLEDRLRPLRILLTAVLVILGLLLALTVASLPHR